MSFSIPWFRSSVGDVGVDFAADMARLLQVRESAGRLRVTGAACCPLTPVDGGDRSAQEWGRELRAAVLSGGFAGRRCTICLPREDVFLQSMKLPVMSDDELSEAVAWEASRQLDTSRELIRSDWIRTGEHSDEEHPREEILVVAARHDVLDARLEAVCAAGLRPHAVDTHYTAVARFLSRHHRRAADVEHCRVVFEVGYEGSSVIILRGDQVCFCKALDIGGRHFNQQIAEKLRLDVEAAGELRQARLRQNTEAAFIDPSTDHAVYEAVRPLLNECARHVLMCLRYASVTFRGLVPSHLVMTGSEGGEPGLADQVASTCQIPVRFDDPKDSVEQLDTDLRSLLPCDPGSVGSWVAAAGLSLRGFESHAHRVRPRTSRVETNRSAAA